MRLLEQMLRQNDPLIKDIYEDLCRIAAQMGNYRNLKMNKMLVKLKKKY